MTGQPGPDVRQDRTCRLFICWGVAMQNIILFIGLAALFALQPAQATTVELTTEFSEKADFSRLRTFAWLESNISYAEANDASATEVVEALIRTRVADSLAEKGYEQLASKGRPDFLVSYHVVVTREDNASQMVGLRPAANSSEALRKGTLIIYAVDAASKRLLWQSVAATMAPTTCEALRETGSVVESMLQQFPSNRTL